MASTQIPIAIEEECGDDAIPTCRALIEKVAQASPTLRDLVEAELSDEPEGSKTSRKAIPEDVKSLSGSGTQADVSTAARTRSWSSITSSRFRWVAATRHG